MSTLYYTEAGNIVPTLCEELTASRQARKVLHLPATGAPAQLFVLARCYPENALPLRVAVNGSELPAAPAAPAPPYMWQTLTLPARLLVAGHNVFELWADSPAMNSWSLALEHGHRDPQSSISSDGGQSWRNERMGYLNVGRGEYVVRVRLAEGQDPAPPPPIWESPAEPRLQRLRELLPPEARRPGPTLPRVRALSAWVSTQWEYRNSGPAAQYAPWDPETILAWGKAQSGHDGRLPIVMCVHYGVTMALCCLAVGIPARCAVFTEDIGGFNGHFTTEVWFRECAKWVMVDANMDAILFRERVPLSVTEIQQSGRDLSGLVEWGPGHAFQVRNPAIDQWVQNVFLPNRCFRHRSVWRRNDFLSHPECGPAGHGSTAYCETDMVWESRDLQEGFGMFPFFAGPDYFDAPPPPPWA
ncbi:MAG TPA: transglutaminase-like domain-containing protein [Anaerolineae bacterium]|mgnify:CR=1 FL=1|nr:transglutaminase-like domain-containing protein [Anaerolineae bacterium]HOQ97788.1 transglutaminase-like domain-containing protein [Anaerolineae bacterium]HPL27216.1 transglutaminase-like domain-containing protein [Anaerolineae bacterium]